MWCPRMSLGEGTVADLGRWSTRRLLNSGFVVHSLTDLAKSASSACWADSTEARRRVSGRRRMLYDIRTHRRGPRGCCAKFPRGLWLAAPVEVVLRSRIECGAAAGSG